ncbi:hypothetical protein WA158_003449 [Blastocystis sp. Blastoise]
MPVSISLDEALQNLRAMFPQFDSEFLVDILKQNRGNVDNTVTMLLALSQDVAPPGQDKVAKKQRKEVEDIEFEFGLDLHREWKKPVPKGFLRFGDDQDLDELLAIQLQRSMYEEAKNSSSAPLGYGSGESTYDPTYHAGPDSIGYMPMLLLC